MSCKNDASEHMVHGICELSFHTHQTHEQTPSQSVFSAFLWCPHNCIFEDSAGHNGPARPRKTNLSVLASETMWYQPILIELLAVLLLLQAHMHFPSPTSRHFPLTTYCKYSIYWQASNTAVHYAFISRGRGPPPDLFPLAGGETPGRHDFFFK